MDAVKMQKKGYNKGTRKQKSGGENRDERRLNDGADTGEAEKQRRGSVDIQIQEGGIAERSKTRTAEEMRGVEEVKRGKALSWTYPDEHYLP